MGWRPELGDVVLGKYRLIRLLGEGGMGVVFEAVNIATEGGVALKMLKPGGGEDDGSSARTARMSREARAIARVKSRFVGRVLDFAQTDTGAPVLVLELLQGHDLNEELRRTRAPLSVEDAVSYVVQACAGVAAAHDLGIVHRDLKPGNLFLDASNAGAPIVRVLDFGLAKTIAPHLTTDITASQETLGTLAYMSPEQVRSTRDVDARTDVWALGVILYRLLMGHPPFHERGIAIAARLLDTSPMPRVKRDGVPPDVVHVIARAMEKDAALRFPDARTFGQALARFVHAPSATTKLALAELDGSSAPASASPGAAPGATPPWLPVPTSSLVPTPMKPYTTNRYAVLLGGVVLIVASLYGCSVIRQHEAEKAWKSLGGDRPPPRAATRRGGQL